MNPVYSPVQPGTPYGNPKNMAFAGKTNMQINQWSSNFFISSIPKLTQIIDPHFIKSCLSVPRLIRVLLLDALLQKMDKPMTKIVKRSVIVLLIDGIILIKYYSPLCWGPPGTPLMTP